MLSRRVLPAQCRPFCVRPVPCVRPRVSPRLSACKAEKAVDVKPVEKEVVEDLPDVRPSAQEIQGLVNVLVDKTDIAEMHLQVGSFELKVRRSTSGLSVSAPAAHAAPAFSIPAAPEPLPIMETLKTVEESVDESLIYVHAPKVGVLRRGKYAGGKRLGKANAVNVGDQVRKGQVLAYVEQLGTFVPLEAPQAGEVVKVLLEEGAPVEYKQVVVELAPSFGGSDIKKGL